jgi:hypothetical protein
MQGWRSPLIRRWTQSIASHYKIRLSITTHRGGGGISNPVGGGSPSSPSGNTSAFKQIDYTELTKSPEFNALTKEEKDAVKLVYEAIAKNDQKKAQEYVEAFTKASAINDPYYKQQFLLVSDSLNRGFVAIDQEKQWSNTQNSSCRHVFKTYRPTSKIEKK